jgi:8-oxo-dGTP diphosphatase
MHKNPFPSDRIVVGALCYVFRGTVDAVNDIDTREVLLLCRARAPHVGLWTPPGGKLELGESPDQGCIREMREETGLNITRLTLRGVLNVYDRAYPIHWLLFIYRADEFTGDIQPTPEGELAWISLRDLSLYPRPYADRVHFPYVLLDSAPFRAHYVYDTPDTLISEELYL